MTNVETINQQHMIIHVDSLSKQKLEQAAARVQKSPSEFVLEHALQAADDVNQGHETIMLSQDDCDVFIDAMENPPKPSTRLKRAITEYKKSVQQ